MAKFNLMDDFTAGGSDLDEFGELLKEIDGVTAALPVDMTDLKFASLRKSDDTSIMAFRLIDAQQAIDESQVPKFGRFTIKNLEKKGVAPEIIDEVRNLTKLFIMIGGTGYWTSSNLYFGLAARANLKDRGAYEPCDELFSLYMRRYVDYAPKGTLIVRELDGMRKAVACFSDKYAYVPQSVITDIVGGFRQDLGRARCVSWTVTQFYTSVSIEFPDVADDLSRTYQLKDRFVPGIILSTSDTGASSLHAVSTLRRSKTLIYLDEYTRKHSGQINPEKELENIDRTVFGNYTKLPAALCGLMSVDLHDPADCMEQVLDQIGIKELLGAKSFRQLRDELVLEIPAGARLTAYDIAVSIMDLPRRLEISNGARTTVQRLAALVKRAAYADYEKANKPVTVTLAA